MRKIKECICDSTEKMGDRFQMIPFCLAYFLQNMANILVADSVQRLWEDAPNIEIAGEVISGKRKERPEFTDIVRVLNYDDIVRSTAQFMQLNKFANWFMEQDEPSADDEGDDGAPICWYDLEFLVDKWNEFAQKTEEGRP